MAGKDFLFTSESVSEGHPDKLCDQVSDAILDAHLAGDPNSRVACESLAKTGMVVVAGEITSSAKVSYVDIVREVVREIGYTDSAMGFDGHTCAILTAIEQQSPVGPLGLIDDEYFGGQRSLPRAPCPRCRLQQEVFQHLPRDVLLL